MLNEHDAPTYWKKRAATLGEAAVGYGDQKLKTQDRFYEERENFLAVFLDKFKPTLDYGCGIGRYAHLFYKDKYLGVDVTADLITKAMLRNPDKAFVHIEEPFLNFDAPYIEQVMTTTVLQHCDNDLVVKILASINSRCPNLKKMYLYENSEDFEKPHVVGRKFLDYMELIRMAGIPYKVTSAQSHIVKGEEHTLTIVDLCDE
jgi:SAM-dependent methyltransferase